MTGEPKIWDVQQDPTDFWELMGFRLAKTVNDVGLLIRRTAEANGTLLAEVASVSRIAKKRFERITSGTIVPTTEELTQIAIALDMNLTITFVPRETQTTHEEAQS